MFIPVDVWFRAFLLTLLVEAPITVVMLRRWERSRPRLLALVVFANLASHPAVWFILTQLLLIGTVEYTGVAEGWAILCEALFYWVALRDLPLPRAIVASVVANVASFLVGALAAAWWPQLFW